jgi:two-component system, LytTR family, response regulator
MLNAIIIEDERHALDKLVQTLAELGTETQVTATLSTVKESIEYLSTHPDADIIFSDVQLSDGLSFDIFSQRKVNIPVIFITAYNEYIIKAFDHNGIDYLLKPVEKEDLGKALLKYNMLKEHFSSNSNSFQQIAQLLQAKHKTRLIVKKGIEHLSVMLDDIVLFYTENKIVYVIDRFGRKYLVDKNLSELEEDLDEKMFFRVNRQYIINIKYVKGFKPYEKVKLQVDLNIPEINHPIIISQETAPAFRSWMYEA